MTKLMKHFRCT